MATPVCHICIITVLKHNRNWETLVLQVPRLCFVLGFNSDSTLLLPLKSYSDKIIRKKFNVLCGATRGTHLNILVSFYSYVSCCMRNSYLNNPWRIRTNLKACSAQTAKAGLYSGSIKDRDFITFF